MEMKEHYACLCWILVAPKSRFEDQANFLVNKRRLVLKIRRFSRILMLWAYESSCQWLSYLFYIYTLGRVYNGPAKKLDIDAPNSNDHWDINIINVMVWIVCGKS